MGLIYSRIYPYLFGFMTIGFVWYFDSIIPYEKLPQILPQTMTLGGIIIGFFSTSLAILYSIDDNKRIINKLKEADYYNIIVSYLLEAIYAGFFLSGVSSIGFFMNFQIINLYDQIFFSIWSSLFIISILLSFRVIRLLGKVLVSK